jgi:hypothetical protein
MAPMASVGRTDATSQKPSAMEINLPGERPAWIGWGEMVYVINRSARNWSILEAWHQPQISVFLLLAVSGMDVIQDELIPPSLVATGSGFFVHCKWAESHLPGRMGERSNLGVLVVWMVKFIHAYAILCVHIHTCIYI